MMARFPQLVALLLVAGMAACRKAETRLPTSAIEPVQMSISSQGVGRALVGKPWVSNVNVVDLDQDGLEDVLVCEGQSNEVSWIRQTRAGQFEEQTIGSQIPGPVHTDVVDFDGDGDRDVLVASMGVIFPNNERIGSILWLENQGEGRFVRRVIEENVARVSDVRGADLNGDGRLDLVVAQFGYDQGEVRWLERLADGGFRSHPLLALSGAINVCVADINGDQTLDVVTVIAQQWEEVVLFENNGQGGFAKKVIFGSTNEDFGSSGISLADLNRDGRLDVLYANGDGFDYAEPGSRPWHGVQWLENVGSGQFRYHRVGDLPGAYSPVAVDLDQDGVLDVVACSGFNDWANPAAASLVWFRGQGNGRFAPQVLAHRPTHFMTLAVGRLGAPARPVLFTGGFHAYPPHDYMSRVLLWVPEIQP